MRPSVRKLVLAAHLTFSVGWVGAAGAYVMLAAAAQWTDDPETVRGAWISMELVGWYVVVPLALGSLITGLAMALGTRWGLFRHYWVIFSLALTSFAAIVLLLHMPTVTSTADRARAADASTLAVLGGDLAHPSIGLVILLVVLVLNVYKPRGLTSYGQRKHKEQSEAVAGT